MVSLIITIYRIKKRKETPLLIVYILIKLHNVHVSSIQIEKLHG
jgi:hypothetical protein